jgi:hypothetical protein
VSLLLGYSPAPNPREIPVPESYVDVPLYEGNPLLSAHGEEEINFYLEWLADYLFRPGGADQSVLTDEEARIEILDIECEIAYRLWDNPFEDYPREDELPGNGARHADILHREKMCAVLSRVPSREYRIWLLHRFYREFYRDFHK